MAGEMSAQDKSKKDRIPSSAKWVFALFVAVVVLLAMLWWGYFWVQNYRVDAQVKIKELEALPDLEVAGQYARRELNDREGDIKKVERMILSEDSIAELISRIEEAAKRRSVDVYFPKLTELEEDDKEASEFVAGKPAKRVRVSISADGDGVNLIMFLRDIEYMPYVMSLRRWELFFDGKSAGGGVGSRAPVDKSAPVQNKQYLEVELLFLMQSNEDS